MKSENIGNIVYVFVREKYRQKRIIQVTQQSIVETQHQDSEKATVKE